MSAAISLPLEHQEDDARYLNRTILRLALPATVAALLRGIFTVTDAWWCGQVGSVALAAFGTASFWVWALIAMSLTASVGIGARVARANGAQDKKAVQEAARDGIVAAFLVSTGLGALIAFFAPELAASQGSAPEVAAEAASYLRFYALGTPAVFAVEAADAVLRGTGDTRTPAVVGLGLVGLNFALDPLFLFGWGPIPAFGVGGIGFSTAIIQCCAALVLWRIVAKRGLITRGKPSWRGVKETLRIGTPSATLGAGFSLIYVAITPAVARFGTAQLAALPIGHRSESFAYFVNAGFSAAAQTLVGNRLGAKRPDAARRVARRVTALACAVTGVYSVVLISAAPTFAQFFNSDPQVVSAASAYLMIVGLSILAQTVEMVLTGAFEGAGDTFAPLMVGVVTHGMRLPLIWLFVSHLGMGVSSIWWTISLCSMLAGVVMAFIYARRRWS